MPVRPSSKHWRHIDSLQPKKALSMKSVGKIMASVFWDAKEILRIYYLSKSQAINSEYCAKLLDKVDKKIHVKRPTLDKKFVFYQDNARLHMNAVTIRKLTEQVRSLATSILSASFVDF